MKGFGMIHDSKKMLMEIAEFLEIVLAVLMIIILVLIILRTALTQTPLIFTEGASIHHYLEEALMLTIAIEFVKMLCMHTPGTIIEVLLFAIARHMIVESLPPVQNLIIVLAIVILFAARKYLLTGHDQKGMTGHEGEAHERKHAAEEAREARNERRQLERAAKALRAKGE